MHEHGIGGAAKDEEKAKQLYERSAQHGHSIAQRKLAELKGDKSIGAQAADDYTLDEISIDTRLPHGAVLVADLKTVPYTLQKTYHWAIYDAEKRKVIEFSGTRKNGDQIKGGSMWFSGSSGSVYGSFATVQEISLETFLQDWAPQDMKKLEKAKQEAESIKELLKNASGDEKLKLEEELKAAEAARGVHIRRVHMVRWKFTGMNEAANVAVERARERLGDTPTYCLCPEFKGDSENCESFVRKCFDGLNRCAQAEQASGQPKGGFGLPKLPLVLLPLAAAPVIGPVTYGLWARWFLQRSGSVA